MGKLMELARGNRIIIWTYAAVLGLLLAFFLLLTAVQIEGYNPRFYEHTYLLFTCLAFLLFSIFVPFLEGTAGRGRNPWQTLLQTFFCLAVFTAALLPLLLLIFIAGRIKVVNYALPLLLKFLWGTALASLGGFLEALGLTPRWKGFLIALFLFLLFFAGGVLLYSYIHYEQAVIVTVYDLRIPLPFFLHPLLTLVGLLHMQVGGASHLGIVPFLFCASFWALFTVLFFWLSELVMRRKGASDNVVRCPEN